MADVVVIGAGHNGLVAAALLARAGLDVRVVERAEVVGGACRTEYPFAKAPDLAASTGAYLLGPMPPEIPAMLDLDLPLVRRDPHYFLPTLDGRALLLGADEAANHDAFAAFFTEADADAADRMAAELAAIRDDVAPAWLAEPLPLEETAERYLRPELRQVFVDMVRGSALEYLDRFGFASPEVVAMYAVTDGMPGFTGTPWDAGSGHSILIHNMCRLPGADGTWMVVRGGMGTVTRRLAEAAQRFGARITLGTPVERVLVTGSAATGVVTGVVTAAGEQIPARAVLAATDPFRLPGLLGEHLPADLAARIEGWARYPGQTMKINLALSDLPTFAALPERRGQHGTTVHLLPPPAAGQSVMDALREAFSAAGEGRLPETLPLEWYLHSTLDPSLRDGDGNHSSALFVQGVPHVPAGSDWTVEKDAFVARMLDQVARYAPDLPDLVVDVHALTPPEIEAHFGITGANIDHVDNAFAFTDRVPYALGLPGMYAGAAGCHPAGSVIGAAGHNAARRILTDLGAAPTP
jgi:phytoene dehydrogenase-like protein